MNATRGPPGHQGSRPDPAQGYLLGGGRSRLSVGFWTPNMLALGVVVVQNSDWGLINAAKTECKQCTLQLFLQSGMVRWLTYCQICSFHHNEGRPFDPVVAPSEIETIPHAEIDARLVMTKPFLQRNQFVTLHYSMGESHGMVVALSLAQRTETLAGKSRSRGPRDERRRRAH